MKRENKRVFEAWTIHEPSGKFRSQDDRVVLWGPDVIATEIDGRRDVRVRCTVEVIKPKPAKRKAVQRGKKS